MPFALWLSLCGFPIHGWAHSLSLNKHEITLPSRKPCILSPFRPGFSSTQKSPRKHALTCALPKHSHTPFFLFPNARNAPNRMSKECTCKCRGKSLNPFACPDIQYSFLKPILYQKKKTVQKNQTILIHFIQDHLCFLLLPFFLFLVVIYNCPLNGKEAISRQSFSSPA